MIGPRISRSTAQRPLLALAALAAAGLGGCIAPGADPASDPASNEPLGVAASPVTAAEAISRAEEWVTAKLLYCQAPNGAADADAACPSTCKREKNADWDPYRSDCSGLVSWAWGLDAPGLTTAEMAPNETGGVTYLIQASALQPGDAVNTDDSASNEHHVMLFKAWTVPGDTATFIEEPGCAATPNYAHEFTSAVTMNGTSIKVAYNGISFKAIRYDALGQAAGAPPTCQVEGIDGQCIDQAECGTMSGYVATPGYCPGPSSEQCCTPVDGTTTSSTGATSGASSGSSGGGAGGIGGALGSGTTSTGAGGAGGVGGTGGGGTKSSTGGGCELSSGEPISSGADLWRTVLGALAIGVAARRRSDRASR